MTAAKMQEQLSRGKHALFGHRINTNSNHVLQPYLPDNDNLPYQLRTRHHNKSLIIKTNFLNDTDFIVQMLYKYSY